VPEARLEDRRARAAHVGGYLLAVGGDVLRTDRQLLPGLDVVQLEAAVGRVEVVLREQLHEADVEPPGLERGQGRLQRRVLQQVGDDQRQGTPAQRREREREALQAGDR